MNDNSVEVKIIRLVTGEDIVGSCLFDDDDSAFLIECPMKVVISRAGEFDKTMLIMMPWLPLEIIEDNIASISYQDVITMVNPKEDFIEYYQSTVDRYDALLEKSKQEGSTFENEFDDEEEELDDETIEQMLESIKERKNKSLH